MTQTDKKHRIIFIDLMRAFAVLQMVQGHTIDALLSPEYRLLDYPAYAVWHFMRGMTAPIFMFTSGTVFTYLFRLVEEPFENNPRVKKGIKRFFLLVFLGYLLRYPTYKIIDFSDVSKQQLDTFFAVDVLQLIGFGLLFLMISAFISEKLKLGDTITFLLMGLMFIIPAPFFAHIDWLKIFPQPIANYFYSGNGSLFPLFPWAGYVITGGVLGSYLARNPLVFKTNKFSLRLVTIGIALILFSAVYILFELGTSISNLSDSYTYDTVIFRIGFVLILTGIVSYISQSINSVPRIIILIGRNTLLIYVVHLVIIYGSAWNPGLFTIWGNSVPVYYTIIIALTMILMMTFLVYLLNKLRIRNKQLVT
ncbi:heparan-alpha-glucosaminide N-acetyltransferase domain-containing protein [Ignavibacterium album]|uniref:heparan-alpha-glucosaminide N-acetyltransferase domain-containing protein n=1 Tax=Ignavibacterium album TaxID=591197 RepID=UPI0026F17E59|nr:heparan-alpha-glucosaminide N-acetyltransferase domain-containing protein [Ignavibacterium album]